MIVTSDEKRIRKNSSNLIRRKFSYQINKVLKFTQKCSQLHFFCTSVNVTTILVTSGEKVIHKNISNIIRRKFFYQINKLLKLFKKYSQSQMCTIQPYVTKVL